MNGPSAQGQYRALIELLAELVLAYRQRDEAANVDLCGGSVAGRGVSGSADMEFVPDGGDCGRVPTA